MEFNKDMLENENFISNIHNEIIKSLNSKFDEYIVEGLKRKGFEFSNKKEVEEFVKLNCTCEDYKDIQERIFFVKSIPFFLHNYEVKFDLEQTKSKTIMYANWGKYSFL